MQKKVLIVLFSTLLLDMIGIGMLVPILPVLFTDPTSPSFILHGYSVEAQYFMAGLLTALFGLMQFIASPILGELSDAYGRKKLLTLGVAVLAVSQLIFGFGIEIASLWLLLVSRMVAGLAGANFSIAQAAIADVSAPNERAKNFGLIGAAFGIGFILGPLLGGFIAETTYNAAAPFWFAGILGIINVLFISLMLPETHKTMSGQHHFHWLKGIHNIRDAFRDRDARPVYLTNFLYMCGFSFFVSFIGVLLVAKFHLSESAIGTFFGVVGVWMVVTQLFLLRLLAGRYSERAILRYTILVVGAAIALYPFMPSTFWIYVLLPVLSVPQGLSFANLGALVSKSVSPEKQGAALGINGSLMALSQGVIPVFGGVVIALVGLNSSFIFGALLVAASWAVLFLGKRRPRVS
ncbi:MAG TPA: MFS transporter [Candidatus Paceibacterota bacterium]|nr:MFS transporter [Candidatus Paceibacterota bacterium]